MLALAEALEADNEKAVKQLAAESRSKDWRALIEHLRQALDEGDASKQTAIRFLHDRALTYAFQWTPDGLRAFERWQERLQTQRLRAKANRTLRVLQISKGRTIREATMEKDNQIQWEEMPEDTRRILRIVTFGMGLRRSSNPPGQEKKANLINSLIEADEAIVDRYWEMLPADLQAPQLAEISLLRADPGSLPAASPEEVTR